MRVIPFQFDTMVYLPILNRQQAGKKLAAIPFGSGPELRCQRLGERSTVLDDNQAAEPWRRLPLCNCLKFLWNAERRCFPRIPQLPNICPYIKVGMKHTIYKTNTPQRKFRFQSIIFFPYLISAYSKKWLLAKLRWASGLLHQFLKHRYGKLFFGGASNNAKKRRKCTPSLLVHFHTLH